MSLFSTLEGDMSHYLKLSSVVHKRLSLSLRRERRDVFFGVTWQRVLNSNHVWVAQSVFSDSDNIGSKAIVGISHADANETFRKFKF